MAPPSAADGLAGRGTPIVLLHGLGMSADVWDGVRPSLEEHHDVVTPALLGHRGGTPRTRQVRIVDLVDDVERTLDRHRLQQTHVVGNSLGGWVAIELARRGRAATVCALSPAGFWGAGSAAQTIGVRKIRRAVRMARLGRPLPVLMRSPRVRRLAFRDVAVHGDRLNPGQATDATRDLLACTIVDDILTTCEEVAAVQSLPCPITLAWSGADAIVPLNLNGTIAADRIPHARFTVLPGVGHVPMIDAPDLVAETILDAVSTLDPATSRRVRA
jgi:pimeloyl-ACP methyl ester carboxylesterase